MRKLALAGMVVAAPAAAEFPTQGHFDELRGCLDTFDNPVHCKGMIYDPCFATLDTDLDPATCFAGERAAWYEVIRDEFAELEAEFARRDDADGDGQRVETLHAAQRAWVAHRNADCAMRAADAPDGARRVEASCTMGHTADRAIELMTLRWE